MFLIAIQNDIDAVKIASMIIRQSEIVLPIELPSRWYIDTFMIRCVPKPPKVAIKIEERASTPSKTTAAINWAIRMSIVC